MAVTTEWTVPQTNRTVYSCLDADTRPADPVAGSICFITDTDAIEQYDGAAWLEVGTKGAKHVYGLARNIKVQAAGTYSTTDILGFICTTPGTGDWTIDPIDGASVGSIDPATFAAGGVYPIHAESITVGTGGEALLFIP